MMVITTPDKWIKYYPACGNYYMWSEANERYERMTCKGIAERMLGDVKTLKYYMHNLAREKREA